MATHAKKPVPAKYTKPAFIKNKPKYFFLFAYKVSLDIKICFMTINLTAVIDL